jgi:hypothetical protein
MSRRRGLSAFLAAGAVALAFPHAARSGVVRRAFTARAVVIASARVSSTIQASGDAVEIRAVGHRSAPAALLVDGQVKVLESAAILAIPPRGEFTVTVLY